MTITIFVQICIVVAFMAALIMVCAWINEVQKKITATKEASMLLNSRLDAWVDILNDFIEDDEKDYKALKKSVEAMSEYDHDNFARIDDNIKVLAITVEDEAKESVEKFDRVTNILNGMDKRYDELEMFIKTQDEKDYQNGKCFDEVLNRVYRLEGDVKTQTKANVELQNELKKIDKVFDLMDNRLHKIEEKTIRVDEEK